ncbi:uncharacterized protein TNCV_4726741 [Trichonephila clavipes]|nr:uncharacterized protein TNCV_4726741 [Trichonephila clavipes]
MACNAEDSGFQMLNNDEIVSFVQEESDPVDDETDEDEDNNNYGSSKDPSHADAFSALEWYEQSECCLTQLPLLKRIRDLAAKRRSVQLHILHGSHSVSGYPNNRVSEHCPVTIESDKRRSTVYPSRLISAMNSSDVCISLFEMR